MKKILFDSSAQDLILSVFGKSIDQEGYIIEADSGIRVLTPDAQEIKKEEFAGITGSGTFLKSNDLHSLMHFLDTHPSHH